MKTRPVFHMPSGMPLSSCPALIGHDLRGHTNEVHANELRRRQEHGIATDRALADATNTLQETARQDKQQAAKGGCLHDHFLNIYLKFIKHMLLVALSRYCSFS